MPIGRGLSQTSITQDAYLPTLPVGVRRKWRCRLESKSRLLQSRRCNHSSSPSKDAVTLAQIRFQSCCVARVTLRNICVKLPYPGRAAECTSDLRWIIVEVREATPFPDAICRAQNQTYSLRPRHSLQVKCADAIHRRGRCDRLPGRVRGYRRYESTQRAAERGAPCFSGDDQ